MLSCHVLWKQHDIFYGKITHPLYIARILWYLFDSKDSSQYSHPLTCSTSTIPFELYKRKAFMTISSVAGFYERSNIEAIVQFLHKRLQNWGEKIRKVSMLYSTASWICQRDSIYIYKPSIQTVFGFLHGYTPCTYVPSSIVIFSSILLVRLNSSVIYYIYVYETEGGYQMYQADIINNRNIP